MQQHELLKLQALHDSINKTTEHFCRHVLRWYSTTFYTPLHEVYNLEWEFILVHYYEHQFDKLNHNQLLQYAKETLPELIEEKEVEDNEFIKQLLEKEQSLKSKESNTNPTTPNQNVEFVQRFDDDEDI